jgi:hypothetical protein
MCFKIYNRYSWGYIGSDVVELVRCDPFKENWDLMTAARDGGYLVKIDKIIANCALCESTAWSGKLFNIDKEVCSACQDGAIS